MRAATVALAAIPVLVGGLGLAIVAGGINPLAPFANTSEDTPISPVSPASPITTPDDAPRESDSGTPIDGQRPHLSVIDGRANLFLPAPLPEIISLLPGSTIDLNPLPSSRGGDGSTLPDPATREPQASPGSSADSGHRPGQQPDARPGARPDVQSTPSAAQSPQQRVDELPAASAPGTPDPPAARPSAPSPLTPGPDGGLGSDRNLPMTIPGESMDHGRPPHADTQGRPPHAGHPGPPSHATGKSNSNGPPGHAATGNRPDHAGTSGRPDHARGGTPKSDDSHPGPR